MAEPKSEPNSKPIWLRPSIETFSKERIKRLMNPNYWTVQHFIDLEISFEKCSGPLSPSMQLDGGESLFLNNALYPELERLRMHVGRCVRDPKPNGYWRKHFLLYLMLQFETMFKCYDYCLKETPDDSKALESPKRGEERGEPVCPPRLSKRRKLWVERPSGGERSGRVVRKSWTIVQQPLILESTLPQYVVLVFRGVGMKIQVLALPRFSFGGMMHYKYTINASYLAEQKLRVRPPSGPMIAFVTKSDVFRGRCVPESEAVEDRGFEAAILFSLVSREMEYRRSCNVSLAEKSVYRAFVILVHVPLPTSQDSLEFSYVEILTAELRYAYINAVQNACFPPPGSGGFVITQLDRFDFLPGVWGRSRVDWVGLEMAVVRVLKDVLTVEDGVECF